MARLNPKTIQSKLGQLISIRSAIVEDAEKIIQFDINTLENAKYFHTNVDEVIHPSEEQCQKRIVKFQGESGSLILIAELNNQIIGKLEFRSGQRKATAHAGYFDMAVHIDLQNQGIGAILINSLLNWIKTHPTIEVVKLEVAEENSPAVALYKKFGFKEIGRDPFAAKINNEFHADLTMLLRLDK